MSYLPAFLFADFPKPDGFWQTLVFGVPINSGCSLVLLYVPMRILILHEDHTDACHFSEQRIISIRNWDQRKTYISERRSFGRYLSGNSHCEV